MSEIERVRPELTQGVQVRMVYPSGTERVGTIAKRDNGTGDLLVIKNNKSVVCLRIRTDGTITRAGGGRPFEIERVDEPTTATTRPKRWGDHRPTDEKVEHYNTYVQARYVPMPVESEQAEIDEAMRARFVSSWPTTDAILDRALSIKDQEAWLAETLKPRYGHARFGGAVRDPGAKPFNAKGMNPAFWALGADVTARDIVCPTTCARGAAEPAEHLPDCPVAPRPGLHGGMRSDPVPAGRVTRWKPYATRGWWEGLIDGERGLLVNPRIVENVSPEEHDLVLAAFYLPPALPDDEHLPLPCDAGDADLLVLEGRAGRLDERDRWRPR